MSTRGNSANIVWSHVSQVQIEISHEFNTSFARSTDKSQSARSSCLQEAFDTVRRSNLDWFLNRTLRDKYQEYKTNVLKAAIEPEKIWDDNHTVDQLLASKGSEYLNSLLSLQSSRSENSGNKGIQSVSPIPEASESEDAAISTWIDGIEMLSKDVKSDTWPTTNTRSSQM
ncbi:uncharacterized protein L199_004724 [Kwoniella botswanensis]|uniref:uncharacterized protein n=1 Tax=Kwoniella botswanensis TaxID=1268659 RepID=UPI00315D1FCF